jgi:hypothetical protein
MKPAPPKFAGDKAVGQAVDIGSLLKIPIANFEYPLFFKSNLRVAACPPQGLKCSWKPHGYLSLNNGG